MSVIRTPRILLRPFRDSDAKAFAEAARESVASVYPWMPWCGPDHSEADALHWFRLTETGRQHETAHEFGVFSPDGQRLLGGAGLNQINPQHLYCNLGYWVRESEQRKGVALECVRVLSEYAFTTLGLHRVEIVVAVGNEASAGVARKAGAQLEGIARNRFFLHGSPVPARMFSLVPAQNPSPPIPGPLNLDPAR